jgi:hypothetical protein
VQLSAAEAIARHPGVTIIEPPNNPERQNEDEA